MKLINQADVVWPEACYWCGVHPQLPTTASTEVNNFIETSDMRHEMKSVLASIGIVHDRHFSLLLKLDNAERMAFLRGLVPKVLDDFRAFDLGLHFNRHIQESNILSTETSSLIRVGHIINMDSNSSVGISLHDSGP